MSDHETVARARSHPISPINSKRYAATDCIQGNGLESDTELPYGLQPRPQASSKWSQNTREALATPSDARAYQERARTGGGLNANAQPFSVPLGLQVPPYRDRVQNRLNPFCGPQDNIPVHNHLHSAAQPTTARLTGQFETVETPPSSSTFTYSAPATSPFQSTQQGVTHISPFPGRPVSHRAVSSPIAGTPHPSPVAPPAHSISSRSSRPKSRSSRNRERSRWINRRTKAEHKSQGDANLSLHQNVFDPYSSASTQLTTVTHTPQAQINPYSHDTAAAGASYYQNSSFTPAEPSYHLYAPISPHKGTLTPQQRASHDFFIPDDLREDLQRKSAAALQILPSKLYNLGVEVVVVNSPSDSGLPPRVDFYHSLVPLDTSTDRKNAALFGYPSWVYKAMNQHDGNHYVLRRLEGNTCRSTDFLGTILMCSQATVLRTIGLSQLQRNGRTSSMVIS